MTVKIKICGVKDIQTAQISKELGADMIGLVFAESKSIKTLEKLLSVK